MKKTVLVLLVLGAVLCVSVICVRMLKVRHEAPKSGAGDNAAGVGNNGVIIPLSIDRSGFWETNEPVWRSTDVSDRAQSKGLLFPPRPFYDPDIEARAYPPAKESKAPFNLKSPGRPSLRVDEKSRAFWIKWERILPRSPDEIAKAQESLALHLASSKQRAEAYANGGDQQNNNVVSQLLARVSKERDKMIEDGYPPEALSDDVLKTLSDKDGSTQKAWREAYLKRLESQGAPRAYIEAYKRAWGLK